MPVLKNPRHEKFAQQVAKGKTADQAYIDAGYKEHRGNASTLRGMPAICERIGELVDKAASKAEISIQMIVAELAKIGFSNILDYLEIQDEGTFTTDFSKLTRDQAAAIQEITVDDIHEGSGQNVRKTRRVKFKLSDKLNALEKLGRSLGMFKDKIEHSGPDGGPLQIVISDVESNL